MSGVAKGTRKADGMPSVLVSMDRLSKDSKKHNKLFDKFIESDDATKQAEMVTLQAAAKSASDKLESSKKHILALLVERGECVNKYKEAVHLAQYGTPETKYIIFSPEVMEAESKEYIPDLSQYPPVPLDKTKLDKDDIIYAVVTKDVNSEGLVNTKLYKELEKKDAFSFKPASEMLAMEMAIRFYKIRWTAKRVSDKLMKERQKTNPDAEIVELEPAQIRSILALQYSPAAAEGDEMGNAKSG